MKKKLTILLTFILLQSCIVYINDPDYHRPPGRPGRQQWWYDSVPQNNGNVNKDPKEQTQKDNGNENIPNNNFIPIVKYDSCTVNDTLVFNVYLGFDVGELETSVMLDNFSSKGGYIIFNIYTNNHYISMYGFEKWRKDFYVFSEETPYCGYSSFSMDTKPICKYKMTIKKNQTPNERYCSGYWSSNYNGLYDGSFKIHLFQCCSF